MKVNKFVSHLSCLLVLLIGFGQIMGQNNTSSLYSLYGLGELAPLGTGPSMAMGGTGLGMRSHEYVNFTNPAANSYLGTQRVLMDMGMFYQTTTARNLEEAQVTQDFNISHFLISTSATPDWRISFGFKPFSNIGYDITTQQTIEGRSDSYIARYEGRGGLSQLFFSNAVRINNRLSLGGTATFLWGEVGKTEQIDLIDGFTTTIREESDNFLAGLNLDFGLQYVLWHKAEKDLTMGLVFDPASQMQGIYSRFVFETGTAGPLGLVSADLDVLEEIVLPAAYGGGLSFGKFQRYRIGADLYHQRWAEATLWDSDQSLNNCTRFSMGGEYSPPGDGYKPQPTFRLGGYVSQSYLQLNGLPIHDFGFSAGMSIPIRGINSVNLAYEYQRRGSTERGLIVENTHRISLSWILSDLWYVKQKVN